MSYVHHGDGELSEISTPHARLDADVRWSMAGDIDGDGRSDVIWTAPDAFYLLPGSVAPADEELSLARGSAVAGVASQVLEGPDRLTGALGDLDGDGFDDFALNAAVVISSPTEVSSPWVLFYGGAHMLDGDADTIQASAVVDAQLYASIRSPGGWDDDGYSDLVLQRDLWLPQDEPGSTWPRAREAVLLRGGPARSSGSYIIPQQRLGLEADPAVANLVPIPAGDLDGDGFADLFVKRLIDQGLDLGIIYGGPLPLPVVH